MLYLKLETKTIKKKKKLMVRGSKPNLSVNVGTKILFKSLLRVKGVYIVNVNIVYTVIQLNFNTLKISLF